MESFVNDYTLIIKFQIWLEKYVSKNILDEVSAHRILEVRKSPYCSQKSLNYLQCIEESLIVWNSCLQEAKLDSNKSVKVFQNDDEESFNLDI